MSSRILSSDSDDVDEENPKTHENGPIGGKTQNLGQSKGGDSDNVVKTNTCFVCDGKDNWVLVCYGEECTIAIHQSCASDEPDFDEFGNFYCPYCWYKRVVVKCLELGKKLMLTDKSRKGCRESLGGVDVGLMMEKEAGGVENVVEVNVSGASGMVSGKRREGDGLNNKWIVIEKSQKMQKVAAETQSRENSKADDIDSDKGRKQRGRFNEKNYEISYACISNAGEGRKGRVRRGNEKNHQAPEAHSIDVGGERKRQRRCDDINHEKAQPHSFAVGIKTKEKRRYSEKNQQNKTVATTHEHDVLTNDGRTEARDSDFGEGRSGQGCFHENNQQTKVSSTERCEQEIPRTNKRVSLGSGLGEGRYREGRHIEKNQHTETVKTETHGKEVSKDRKRKRERGVERDGDEFYLAENQDRQCQADMRNDDVAFNKQATGFSTVEQVERKSVSSISSPESTNNVNDPNVAFQELALIIHPKAGVQEQPIEARPLRSVSSKKPSFQPEKYGHKSYLEKNGPASNDPAQSATKRKRRFWTLAEVEMLRVGVQKFPGERNIPWRKILQFGRDVFHDERAPSDLKDKWKTLNKIPSDTGKWVSLSTERQPNYYVSEVSSE